MDEKLFLLAFPFLFLGMWLLVTTLLGGMSGWFTLQRKYGRSAERPSLTLHMRSGTMGVGVHLNGILTLSACPSGLQVAVWRVFGLFQRPFLVPWTDISSEPITRFFQPMTRLSFGSPEVGRLTVDRRSWERLYSLAAAHAYVAPGGGLIPPIKEREIARGLIIEWAIITAGATVFFYVPSRFGPDGLRVSLAVCFGFPALVFGFSQLVRYLVQRGSPDRR